MGFGLRSGLVWRTGKWLFVGSASKVIAWRLSRPVVGGKQKVRIASGGREGKSTDVGWARVYIRPG